MAPVQSQTPEHCRTNSFALLALGLAVLTLTVYWKVQYHEFLVWDDYEYVVKNPHVHTGLLPENLLWAFSFTDVSYWHPLSWLSHMLDCELYGLNPRGHHFNSVLIHTLNSLLLFWVLRRMTGALWKSAMVAALFSIHPLRIESVAWVTERKDVLGAFFWILTIGLYDRYTRRPTIGRYLSLLFSFAMGLMCKPMLVTLPFTLFLLDYWPLGRIRLGRAFTGRQFPLGESSALTIVLEKLPLILLSAASSAITFWAADRIGSVPTIETLSLQTRSGNALVSLVMYLWKTIWPSKLAFFYPFSATPWGPWHVAGCALLLGCISLFAIIYLRRHPPLSTGWLWYLGTLFPVIGIVQVGTQGMADRFTYIPHIGLFIAVVWSFSEVTVSLRRPFVLPLFAGLILLVLSVSTSRQLTYWKDGVTLFSRALEVTTGNETAHYMLGCEWMRRGRSDLAVRHFSEALRIKPGHLPARQSLGVALAYQGKTDAALAQLLEALSLQPGNSEIHSRIGDVHMVQGRPDDAISSYMEALRLDPSLWKVHNNLGVALLKMERFLEAKHQFEEALRLNPVDRKAGQNLEIVRRKIQANE